jgi:hypothetical protein
MLPIIAKRGDSLAGEQEWLHRMTPPGVRAGLSKMGFFNIQDMRSFPVAEYPLRNSAILHSGRTLHVFNEVSRFNNFRSVVDGYLWAGEQQVDLITPLQPLLVAEVGYKGAAVPVLHARLVNHRQHFANRLRRCNWTLETGCVFRKLGNHLLRALYLFLGRILECTGGYQAWGNAQEKHPLAAILGTEFGDGSVERGFADSIRCSDVDVELGNHVNVGHASRNSDDLFCVALQDEWQVDIDKMDIADYVVLEMIEQVLFERIRLISTWGNW